MVFMRELCSDWLMLVRDDKYVANDEKTIEIVASKSVVDVETYKIAA